MSSHATDTASQLRASLHPMLRWDSPERASRFGRRLAEGFELPDADTVAARARRPEEIEPMLADAVERLRNTVRSDWLAEPVGQRLFGVPESVNGEDALIGAWRCNARTIQVVVTRERFHLMAPFSVSVPSTSSDDTVQRLFASAYELLQLDAPPEPAAWTVRRLDGDLTVASQQLASPETSWQTLVLMTDGRGVKFSIRKLCKRAHRPSVGMMVPAIVPWFPPPGPDEREQAQDHAEDDESDIEDWVEDEP